MSDSELAFALQERVEELEANQQTQAQVIVNYMDEEQRLLDKVEQLRAALESIAANTCCERCQEAALVAREALGAVDND